MEGHTHTREGTMIVTPSARNLYQPAVCDRCTKLATIVVVRTRLLLLCSGCASSNKP